ncbi:hypothetical protein Bca4012_072308 [Brassica carinata]
MLTMTGRNSPEVQGCSVIPKDMHGAHDSMGLAVAKMAYHVNSLGKRLMLYSPLYWSLLFAGAMVLLKIGVPRCLYRQGMCKSYLTQTKLKKSDGAIQACYDSGLWEHITTSEAPRKITQGADGKEIVVVDEGKWGQEDLMVLSSLQGSLDTPIMEAYSHCETAKQLWETLHKIYGNTSNLTRIFEVKRAINNLQQEKMDFTKHFGKYSQLWSELDMLRPSTNDPNIIEERREQDKVFGLLLTLNPNGLLGGKGELYMANKVEKVENAAANKAHFKPRGGGGDKQVTCEHCQLHPTNTIKAELVKLELKKVLSQTILLCAWEKMGEP